MNRAFVETEIHGHGLNHDILFDAVAHSPVYHEYERAFAETTDLPVNFRPIESWQLPHHGKKNENPRSPDLATATHLYRIAQEAVNNAAKHARASLIEVTLATGSGRFLVEVADNGIGVPEPPTIGAGMGLHIMQYRASMIGASLKVSRRPAAGTVVACSVAWNQRKSKAK